MNGFTTTQERDELKARLDGIRDNSKTAEEQRAALQAEIDKLTAELEAARTALENALQDGTEQQVVELSIQINSLHAELAEAQQTIEDLTARLNEE